MLAAFRNAIYSPKVGQERPGTTRHGIRLHDRLQSFPGYNIVATSCSSHHPACWGRIGSRNHTRTARKKLASSKRWLRATYTLCPEYALGEHYTPERAADFVKFAEARYPR
jgi:hypothetical protein